MIDRLIEISLRNRFLVVALWIGLAAWGLWAMLRAPIDAIPDLSDNQVIVFTDWSGRSPQEVEDQITYPLTVNLQGLPGVRVVRSSSAFGFSMIFVIFEDDVDLYFARTRVLERLNLVAKQMPPGVVPTLGPDATGVGHVFWYTLEGGGLSLRDLRTLQDWYVRYQLNSVPGVAEVASVGGEVQQYQIDVDPNRLRTYALPLSTVVGAVMASNSNVGGNVVSENGSWSIVRGLGLIQNLDDIRNIAVASHNGTPVYVKDVGTVQIGDAFRTAALVRGSEEAVGGVVVARTGENTEEVIDRVKAKLRELEPGLPPGVRVVAFYDRSELIEGTVDTLRRALIEEILLVTLAHVVFLMHFRSILVVTLPLPLAVLCSFLLMHYAHITSNVMSLAGIAIAIGVLVDAGIVVTENAFRHLEGADTREPARVLEIVMRATKLVGRPTFFSMAIIVLAFVPVFALTGQEGKPRPRSEPRPASSLSCAPYESTSEATGWTGLRKDSTPCTRLPCRAQALQKVSEREADLRDEHHSVHVRPRHVVLFDREVFRAPQHQVQHVQTVDRHHGAENLQQPEAAGQHVRRGADIDHDEGNHERRRNHPGRPPHAVLNRQRAAAAATVAFHVGEILRRRRAQEKETEDRADVPRFEADDRLHRRPARHFQQHAAGDRNRDVGPDAEPLGAKRRHGVEVRARPRRRRPARSTRASRSARRATPAPAPART